MSDFVPRDILPDLWEEILQRHWTFLETEESMQKLEERKKLEGCLKEFLCIVPHDRKFFLPETSHVLKKSIREMDDFSAYKAMIGFESISQYANNLFTKPWRKEYRIIKMYSGFYQHEIKSNLIDADKLFEAMGYKQLPNQILMLDGPICPDQVTNVSRDAMAAYVECQIMKQIFSGLTSMQLSCSWQDVFNFREAHIGGASQAIKSMAYAVQERRFRKEKFNSENCYGVIQPSLQQQIASCPSCAHQYHHHHLSQQQQPYTGGICTVHAQQQPQNIYMQNNIPVPHHFKQPGFVPPQMSHSKSLEHYGEHINPAGILPHRHSFDQPYDSGRSHYDVGYDCTDGYQSCNFNAYNHPYNVSGNRYPLPYNISNQLNNQYGAGGGCGVGNAGHYGNPPIPPPPSTAIASCGHKLQVNDGNCYQKLPSDQLYGECNGYTKKPQDICNYHNNSSGTGKDLINYRQCAYMPNGRSNNVRTEQLIDFDDRPNDNISTHSIQQQPPPTAVPAAPHRSQNNSFDYNDRIYDQGVANNSRQHKTKHSQHYDIPRAHLNITQTPKDLYNKNIENSDDMDGNYIYATSNIARPEKKYATRKIADKYTRNAEILEQYEKAIDNNDQHSRNLRERDRERERERDRDRDSYDSYEEATGTGGGIETSGDSSRSKSVSNKNQDGVGSFESWDYVFQNLEKHGYTKDLGERGDLLVQGLDLDSMNVTSASDKRRSRNLDGKGRAANESSKSKTLEKTDLVKEMNNKTKALEKSILKHDNETVQKTITKTTQVQKSNQPKSHGNSTKSTLVNNNHTQPPHHHESKAPPTTRQKTSAAAKDRPAANGTIPSGIRSTNAGTQMTTQVTVNIPAATTTTSPSEWSCRFCTYLNPDTKRICEMCCRSKDFNLDATNPPTCV